MVCSTTSISLTQQANATHGTAIKMPPDEVVQVHSMLIGTSQASSLLLLYFYWTCISCPLGPMCKPGKKIHQCCRGIAVSCRLPGGSLVDIYVYVSSFGFFFTYHILGAFGWLAGLSPATSSLTEILFMSR